MRRTDEPDLAAGAWARCLEALGAADLVAFRLRPTVDALRLEGSLEAVGLEALSSTCGVEAFLALVHPLDAETARAALRPASAGTPLRLAVRLDAAGEAREIEWRGAWLEGGEAAGVVRLRAGEEPRDPLTGLLNRRAFVRAAEERLREGGGWRMVGADLARFNRLNEALGPSGADLVLKALASRLLSAFPASALPARFGEDEFAVLLSDPGQSLEGAEALRKALERPLRVEGFDIHPSLWIAEAWAPGGQGEAGMEDLLRRLGLALEAARGAGKSPVANAISTSSAGGLVRLALEADLHGALERGEIAAYYQPIAHLGTGRLVGFEALARWRHPVRGLVLPDEFLPLLADAGLMSAVGRHMLTAAAAQVAAWRRAHPVAGDLFIAVNLSTGELEDDRLVGFVADRVREHGLPPRALKVEITEGDVMRDPERAAQVLADLRAAGAGISLDDFGTGFSSLSYLTRLPLETLKIDRYFVRTMAENEGSAKIVRSVASLGRDLGLEVVAEGVETLQVARQLHALGCEYGQGYGYAPALDAQAAEVYLNESYLDDGAPIRAQA